MGKRSKPLAVVTGASRGIGAEIAAHLSRAGYALVLTARDRKRLESVARRLDGEAIVIPADLRKVASVNALAKATLHRAGIPDAVINVAGVWHDERRGFQGPVAWETPFERTAEIVDVGLLGAMRVLRGFLPSMVKRGGGHVVQLGCGFAGPHEARGWVHYYVTNKAISALTEGLAAELRPARIRVNCIAPWFVRTPHVVRFYPDDARRALPPARVAEAVLALLQGALARDMSGQTIELRSEEDT